MKLYHKSNLVYIVVFPQFLIFQQNNSAETSVLIFFMSRNYYLFEKLKIVEKQLCKLSCSDGKVSHTLNEYELDMFVYTRSTQQRSIRKYFLNPCTIKAQSIKSKKRP